MHLDTVFTFCNRELVTIYEPVVKQILPILYRPNGNGGIDVSLSERSFVDEVADALGLERASLLAGGPLGSVAIWFAASRSERVAALVVFGTSGRLRDTVYHSILAGEWPAVKKTLESKLR